MQGFTALFAMLLLAVFSVYSQIPGKISYQGILTESDGEPLPDGDYSVQFSFYNSETEGSPVWTEIQTISLANGIFSVKLGENNPINLTFDAQY